MTANVTKRIVDSELVLRNHSAIPVTGTQAEAGILMFPRNHSQYKAVIDISSIDVADADETYEITIEVSDSVGGLYKVMATLTSETIINGGNGQTHELPLSGRLAYQAKLDSKYCRVKVTLGGTTPSISYGCFLTII